MTLNPPRIPTKTDAIGRHLNRAVPMFTLYVFMAGIIVGFLLSRV